MKFFLQGEAALLVASMIVSVGQHGFSVLSFSGQVVSPLLKSSFPPEQAVATPWGQWDDAPFSRLLPHLNRRRELFLYFPAFCYAEVCECLNRLLRGAFLCTFLMGLDSVATGVLSVARHIMPEGFSATGS